MRLPISISQIEPHDEIRWNRYYSNVAGRDRTSEEGIWRRTQVRENCVESGWLSYQDMRRRIVYYRHAFGLQHSPLGLQMEEVFIYNSWLLPRRELAQQLERIRSGIASGGWMAQSAPRGHGTSTAWRRGDLICEIREYRRHPEDEKAQRSTSSGYLAADVFITNRSRPGWDVSLPWQVLAQGMRRPDVRGNPTEIRDLSILAELAPFHVEVGCGMSLEAGVPALNHLHDLYCVTDRTTGEFVFAGDRDDLLVRLVASPESEIPELAVLFLSSFFAEPTDGHRALRELARIGVVLEPVLTNNFDGLLHRVGLREECLRRYDELVPDVEFDSAARALLVIGSHADRRRVQERARKRGLAVVFLDPEGYRMPGGFVDYPLEGPQDSDMLCRREATPALLELLDLFGARQ